jgi:rubrerythrin
MHTSGQRRLLLPATGNDVEVVAALLQLERDAVRIYEAAQGRVDGALGRLTRRILDQERAHARGLARSLRRLGESPPSEPGAQIPGLEGALARGPRAFAGFASRHEADIVAAYLQALERLRRPGLRSPVASILANEGQHLSLLREELGGNPVPRAFETGAVH